MTMNLIRVVLRHIEVIVRWADRYMYQGYAIIAMGAPRTDMSAYLRPRGDAGGTESEDSSGTAGDLYDFVFVKGMNKIDTGMQGGGDGEG